MKNVLFDFSYRPRYYITKPWKFFHEIGVNLRNAWHRITKGYCYMDVCNFDSWFLEVAPAMLRELSNGDAYPDNDGFDTYEKWQEWLRKQADNLEACREENIENQNEYKEEFYRTLENIRFQRNTPEGGTTITFSDEPDVIAIRDKYFARNAELYNERCVRLQATLNELGRHWFHLWD